MGKIVGFTESCRALSELFFPRHCVVCGQLLQMDERHICQHCMADMPLTYFWDWVQNPAYERLSRHVPVHSAVSLFFFRELAGYNGIVHSVKYCSNLSLGREMGRMLGEKILRCPWMSGIDAVVAVPLHPWRYWKRGYNQAEEIARGIAQATGVPLVRGLLHRTRYTKTQTRLKGERKYSNVSGAFSADLKRIRKMAGVNVGHILLVDDVITTGSTLSECAGLLLPYFEVSAASLAFVEQDVR